MHSSQTPRQRPISRHRHNGTFNTTSCTEPGHDTEGQALYVSLIVIQHPCPAVRSRDLPPAHPKSVRRHRHTHGTLGIRAPGGGGNAGSATERGRGRAVHRLSACALSSPSLSLTASEAVCALSSSYGFDTRIFFFFFCLPFTGVGGTPVAERLRARGASGCDTPVSSAWPPWRSRWSPGECVS